jgi:hypothetical protein
MPTRFTAARAWALAEDSLFPALALGPHARALYYHLLRATHLKGHAELRITTRQLARATAQSTTTVRVHLRRLERAGCLRIAARTRRGLKITVRTPEEIIRRGEPPLSISTDEKQLAVFAPPRQKRHANPFKNPALRKKIFRRDGGRCFYCLRTFRADDWTLDHVISRAAGGADEGANAVAACAECNVAKGSMRADDFLRALYRRQRLTSAELHGRLRALQKLQGRRLQVVGCSGDLRAGLFEFRRGDL